jgi:hypothetical protein
MSGNYRKFPVNGDEPGDLLRIRLGRSFPRTSASGGGKPVRRIQNDTYCTMKIRGNPEECGDVFRESDRYRPRMQFSTT